jgi:cell division topological specificity factor
MTLFDLFKRRGSAPVARERLQVLLAYERKNRDQPDLVAVLREEIMAVITKHVQVDQDDVHVAMERGETMSTLEIDIQIPNAGVKAAGAKAGEAKAKGVKAAA